MVPYLVGNDSTKNYWNRTTSDKVTVEGWLVYFFATQCISYLNTEVDWIFLAVDVTLWVVYVCALVTNPRLATDRFLKTGHSDPHFADKLVVDSRNAAAALFFGNKTYVYNFA